MIPQTIEIRTQYLGPTDARGARIRATGLGKQRTVGYDHAASDPHAVAVRTFLVRAGWPGWDSAAITLTAGGNDSGTVRVYAVAPPRETAS